MAVARAARASGQDVGLAHERLGGAWGLRAARAGGRHWRALRGIMARLLRRFQGARGVSPRGTVARQRCVARTIEQRIAHRRSTGMAQQLNGKRVAILVADGFEQVEMTEPRQALEEAGARTEIVSP